MKQFLFLCTILITASLAGCVAKQTAIPRVRESQELPRGAKVKYEGGAGESREEAVIISGAADLKEGVRAEYDFISEKYGKKDKDWRVRSQTQIREEGRIYDMIEMEIIATQESHYYYFDISNCSWTTPSEE
jgi:hypothetical protein